MKVKCTDERLVLEVYRSCEIKSNIVRLTNAAADQIRQLQRATGWPASKLLEKLILYAAERVEVKEV